MFRFGRLTISIAAMLALAACNSLERFTERQARYQRYQRLLRGLPQNAARADLYAILPPQARTPPPKGMTILGVGALNTEVYPLDADFEVVVPFRYARSREICWPMVDELLFGRRNPKWPLPRDIRSPQDMIFPGRPTIESRHDRWETTEGGWRVPAKR